MYKDSAGLLSVGVEIAGLVVGAIPGNACVAGAARVMETGSFSIPGTLGVGVRRVPAVLVVTVLTMLVCLVGLVALIVPGIIAITALSVSGPICVLEGRGPIEGLRRS